MVRWGRGSRSGLQQREAQGRDVHVVVGAAGDGNDLHVDVSCGREATTEHGQVQESNRQIVSIHLSVVFGTRV